MVDATCRYVAEIVQTGFVRGTVEWFALNIARAGGVIERCEVEGATLTMRVHLGQRPVRLGPAGLELGSMAIEAVLAEGDVVSTLMGRLRRCRTGRGRRTGPGPGRAPFHLRRGRHSDHRRPLCASRHDRHAPPGKGDHRNRRHEQRQGQCHLVSGDEGRRNRFGPRWRRTPGHADHPTRSEVAEQDGGLHRPALDVRRPARQGGRSDRLRSLWLRPKPSRGKPASRSTGASASRRRSTVSAGEPRSSNSASKRRKARPGTTAWTSSTCSRIVKAASAPWRRLLSRSRAWKPRPCMAIPPCN